MKIKSKYIFLGICITAFGYYLYKAYQSTHTFVQSTNASADLISQEYDDEEELANKNILHVADTSDYVSPIYQEEKKGEPVVPVKRRIFVTNKMWRDDAPKKLEQEDGAIVHVRTLSDEEYKVQLGLKLMEESEEVLTAGTKEELMSEIGDVYEVLDCIIHLHNLSKDDIKKAQDKKRQARGSYLTKQYVTTVECLPDGFMVPYYLKDPARHPEITV